MKMNIKYIIGILIGILLISSCSKDGFNDAAFPDDIFTEPVFKIQGTLGLDPVNIQAGINDFYMYTDFEEDSLGNNTLIGRFAAEDGSVIPGDEELKFSIKTLNNYSYPTQAIDSLRLSDYTYLSNNNTGFLYSFSSLFLNSSGFSADSYFWSFDFSQNNFTQFAEILREDDSPFSANHTIVAGDDCFANTSGWVSPDVESDSTFLVDISFSTNLLSNTVDFFVDNPNLSSVTWLMGSDTISTEDSLEFDLALLGFNVSAQITARTFDQFGRMSTSIFSISTQTGQPEVCMTKIQYEVNEVSVSAPNPTNSVIIEYQKDGRKYSTSLRDQPADSFFTISEITEFDINERGAPTLKCKVKFNAQLYNTDTGDARPFVAEGYVGVAYEN